MINMRCQSGRGAVRAHPGGGVGVGLAGDNGGEEGEAVTVMEGSHGGLLRAHQHARQRRRRQQHNLGLLRMLLQQLQQLRPLQGSGFNQRPNMIESEQECMRGATSGLGKPAQLRPSQGLPFQGLE